jgi:eukaryotic-like serine/threonine-protein kinase
VPERYLGKTLGKYRVDELIGSGGFAWVYKAFDPELEIPIALKVLKPQFAGDATFEERFRREASTAAKLRHPNIIKIFAVGRDGDAVYFAMDYLPNGLADRLEIVNCLPEEFVARVGMDVASALGFAHREGVIHRDIKVDNILFDAHGNAVVADFGIARAVSGYAGQTGTNMVVGTPQYFAPEQARAKPLDGRADIYSLGVTLYRASTGRLPFEGDDWYEIARQHVEEPPPAPRSLNPNLSPDFERLLLSCLAKHPDDRPATGEVLSQQFAALLHEQLGASTIRTRIISNEPTIVVESVPGSNALVPIGATSPAKVRVRRAWQLSAVALVLIAATLAFYASHEDGTAGTGTATPDSAAAVTAPPRPDSAAAAAAQLAARDSIIRDSLLRDSVAKAVALRTPPLPRLASLTVTAPEGASITVDGVGVGDGPWHSDSLKPGPHRISASVDALEGCPTATQSFERRLVPGQRATLALTPRGCGTVMIAATASGPAESRYDIRYALTPWGSSEKIDGTIPLQRPLVVPVGNYALTIERRMCSTFKQETLTVASDRAARVTARLLCF